LNGREGALTRKVTGFDGVPTMIIEKKM